MLSQENMPNFMALVNSEFHAYDPHFLLSGLTQNVCANGINGKSFLT